MGFSFHYDSSIDFNHRTFNEDFLIEKLEQFQKTINDEKIGFFHITDQAEVLKSCQDMYERFKDRKTFVQVGIGGSALGPQMLIEALRPNDCDTQFLFFDNIDPDLIYRNLSKVDPSESLFYIVSKSGGTAETVAGLAIIVSWLAEKGISENDLKNHLVFCTDPVDGDLRKLAKDWEIQCLEVPKNIGGRFSVLSSVGLFPALFANIKIDEIYDGANLIKRFLLNQNPKGNDLLKTASTIFSLKEQGINETVLMPYSSFLRSFSDWFVQLWAESLGKEVDLNGETVNEGLTPVASYGATDQHSQVQLFMEGPKNKLVFFIEVQKFEHDYSLENTIPIKAAEKLSPYNLTQLMKAELNGTLMAMSEKKRPYIHIVLDAIDERNIGALILFFESLTALMGHYLKINPFDQPGVEAGKKYAFEWLNKLSES